MPHPAYLPSMTVPAPQVGTEDDRAAAGGEEKRAYVRQIFSDIAPSYDLLNHLLSLNVDKRWRRRALEVLQWTRNPAGSYVDLCAGTLDVGAELSRRPGFRGFIVGADFAEPMLRAGAGKAPITTLVPVVADALQLPVRADSADGAIVAFGIRNVADLDACLREVYRILKPDARFVILEFTTPRSSLVRAGYHLYFHHVLPLIGGIISGNRSAYRYLPKSVAHFPDELTLAQRMSGAGFRAVGFTTLSLGIAAIHWGEK